MEVRRHMSINLARIAIRNEEDVVEARRQARDIAGRLGFDANDQTRLATAVSEIARNAFNYAGGGAVEFGLEQFEGAAALEVRVSDSGPGISDLKKILAGTYRSKTGMGLGIIGAKRLMDDFQIQSEEGAGATVTLVKRVPANAPRLTPQKINKITAEVAKAAPVDLMEDLRGENRELLRVLDELRSRQEDLSRLNAELEDTNRGVVALYAELDEKAERLRRADQMKSRFLSHMSHEFRTPLASILALSRLLIEGADGKLGPEQHKQVTFIRKSAESLLEMVNDLLDLARVEAGKSVVRPTTFTVASLFGALRGVLRPLQINESVELIFEDVSGMPELKTDESKVAQILRNFVSNALKFTEKGEVRVASRLSAGSVVFAVSDTGIGIAPENVGLIFQEFGQVDSTMQRKFRGSGLGLPLSKGLAELLGGRVWLESEPGKGSTFYAEIPLVYRGEEAGELSAAAIAVKRSSSCDLVLIDDEEVSRYLIRQTLGPGIALVEATDGQSGIELARQQNPKGILLDLRMPGMSGFEVLRQLKADEATRDIPVVIVTSKILTPEERGILDAQATAVLSKEVLSQPDCGERIRHAIGYSH
jgi:signal transduction histidine kinase/CheY-like chemotaxis protein